MERILVAEDSFALANLLEFVLGNAGYEVSIHRTGASACEAASNEPFDVLLLDQQMPEMTGIEVLESIRKSGPNQTSPVFLCTAKTHELDLENLQEELSITEVFHKPFSPKDLLNRVRDRLATPDPEEAFSN